MLGWMHTGKPTGRNSRSQNRYASGCLALISPIRVVSERGQKGRAARQKHAVWGDGEPDLQVLRAAKRERKGGWGARVQLIYMCPLGFFFKCLFSVWLRGGYQGEHASQPHTTWSTIITHILGKHVGIHVWHCSNIQTHALPQTRTHTHAHTGQSLKLTMCQGA